MKPRFSLLLLVAAMISAQAATWTADNDDGTFTNPLFYDEFSDPDMIRVGAEFYLTRTPRTWVMPNTGHSSPPSAPDQRNDNFSGPKLANVWQWKHVPNDSKWSLTGRAGSPVHLIRPAATFSPSDAEKEFILQDTDPGQLLLRACNPGLISAAPSAHKKAATVSEGR